jgi:hypothetical protein
MKNSIVALTEAWGNCNTERNNEDIYSISELEEQFQWNFPFTKIFELHLSIYHPSSNHGNYIFHLQVLAHHA